MATDERLKPYRPILHRAGVGPIISQLPIKAWHDIIGEPTFADARHAEHDIREGLPFNIGAPDIAKEKLLPGQYDPKPKDIRSLMGNPEIFQPLNQNWVDTAEKYLEVSRNQGKQNADLWARGLLEDYWRSK